MRILRLFTRQDLIATAEATQSSVYELTLALTKAGILRKHCDQYQMIRNLGPYVPSIRADGSLFDHNSKTIIPIHTGNAHE